MKIHTLLDLRGKIPTVIRITPAELNDIQILDDIVLEPRALYVMDRGYLDFARIHRWTQAGAFLVRRARKDFLYRRMICHMVDKSTGFQSDQTILLKWFYSVKGDSESVRSV